MDRLSQLDTSKTNKNFFIINRVKFICFFVNDFRPFKHIIFHRDRGLKQINRLEFFSCLFLSYFRSSNEKRKHFLICGIIGVGAEAKLLLMCKP